MSEYFLLEVEDALKEAYGWLYTAREALLPEGIYEEPEEELTKFFTAEPDIRRMFDRIEALRGQIETLMTTALQVELAEQRKHFNEDADRYEAIDH